MLTDLNDDFNPFRPNVSNGPVLRRSLPDLWPRGHCLRRAGPGGQARPPHLRLPKDDEGTKIFI